MDFNRREETRIPRAPQSVQVGGEILPIIYTENAKARHYVLRLRSDGSARVTIPRRGSQTKAGEFLLGRLGWLERQLQRLRAQSIPQREWNEGSEVLFRGEPHPIRSELLPSGLHRLHVGSTWVDTPDPSGNLRPIIEGHLFQLARIVLPARTRELALAHDTTVQKIAVRNLRSKWGSCSTSGSISLNWRLIQAPDAVRDYVILHELMHFREMNHSDRFWHQVARVCPDFEVHERWLKTNAARLGL